VASIKMALLSLLNGYDLYSDITMYTEVAPKLYTDTNVCDVANNRLVFNPKVGHLCISNGRCDYPNITEIGASSIKHSRNDFESYYHLLYEANTDPYIEASPEDNPFIKSQVKAFQGLCESLHRYPTSDECEFVPGNESLPLKHDGSDKVYDFTMSNGNKTTGNIGCYREYDPVEKGHRYFRYFFYTSIVIYGLKELYKVVVLLYVLLTGRNDDGRHSTILYASIGSPFMLIFRQSILQEIMTHEPSADDILYQLVMEAIGENVLQLSIAIYYAFYIQEVGIELSVAFSFTSNVVGLLWKVYGYCVTRRQKVKQRALVPSSPHPSNNVDSSVDIINPMASSEMVPVNKKALVSDNTANKINAK
jgi:hypothetical protein